MKQVFLIAGILATSMIFAQNIQLHYDINRKYCTTTLEMFKPDVLGSTFWFVDIDYNDNPNGAKDQRQSSSSAYWEIVRMFNTPITDFTVGLQYNDGHNILGGFGSVYFVGVGYPIDLKFVTLNTSIWYQAAENQAPNLHFTVVWFKPLLEGKLHFQGLIDLWGQDNADFDDDGADNQFVILAEPQMWYGLTEKIRIGGEIELSKNFIFSAGSDFEVKPTIALKWIF